MRLAGRPNLTTPGLREDAVRAARRVFVEKGYGSATLEEIAAAVKLTRPSLLHHFPSKAHLAAAVRTEVVHQLFRRIMPWPADKPREGIARLAGGYLDFFGDDPESGAYLLQSELLHLPADATAELRAAEQNFRTQIVAWFSALIRARVLTRLPQEAYEALVLGPSRDYARRWLATRRHKELARVRPALVEAAWNAVRF